MSSKNRLMPQFQNEGEEREFWTTHGSTKFIDWSKAEKNPSFSRLQLSSKSQDDLDKLKGEDDGPS